MNSVAELEAKESHFTPIPNRDERPPVTRTAQGQRLLTIRPEVHPDPWGATQLHPRPLRGVGVDLTCWWGDRCRNPQRRRASESDLHQLPIDMAECAIAKRAPPESLAFVAIQGIDPGFVRPSHGGQINEASHDLNHRSHCPPGFDSCIPAISGHVPDLRRHHENGIVGKWPGPIRPGRQTAPQWSASARGGTPAVSPRERPPSPQRERPR